MTLVRTAVLLLLAIAVALAALIAAPRPAHGCSPPYPPIPLSDYAADTEVAFAGRQIARIRPNDPSYHSALSRSEGITLIFEVERVFKGQAGPLLAARTGYGSGDCGIDYGDMGIVGITAQRWEEDGGWGEEPGDLIVSFGFPQYAINELEEEFGPGYPPDETIVEVAELLENPDQASTGTYLLIGGVAVVLVGGAVLAFRPGIRAAASGFIRAWYWSRSSVGASPRRASDDR